MASVVISGDTSGTATIQAQAVAGNTVLTLPTTSGTILTNTGGVTPGTSGNVLTSDGTNWVSSAGPVGVNQTWTDVKTSPGRVLGTTYTNSTGKPIQLSVTINHPSAANSEISISVNSVVIGTLSNNYGVNTPETKMGLQHIIPNGATYAISVVTGSPTISLWFELR
jgi:hypothetical protein